MAKSAETTPQARFSFVRDDIESRLGLRGGRFTRVHNPLWFLVAVLLTAVFYGCFFPLREEAYIRQVFYKRGPCQPFEVLFSFWAFCIVLVKFKKTKVQKKALELKDLVPVSPDFVLSPATVGLVLGRLRKECEDPGKFILFNRIEVALANLKNMGQIGDVDNVLQSQAGNDEDIVESSYSLVKGLIWAIPVLGFIGTVQGLSQAMGWFSNLVTQKNSGFEQIREGLTGVLAGLATAFETTLVALVAALAVQLLLTLERKGEEEMLDACKEYCQRHIVGRLRLTLLEAGR